MSAPSRISNIRLVAKRLTSGRGRNMLACHDMSGQASRPDLPGLAGQEWPGYWVCQRHLKGRAERTMGVIDRGAGRITGFFWTCKVKTVKSFI